VIAEANKPAFFTGRNVFREISKETGHTGSLLVEKLERGKVYFAGNQKAFESMAGITVGDAVLYVGDHIFSDVMISKKRHAWRTCLIIPELSRELECAVRTRDMYYDVIQLARQKSVLYSSLDPGELNPEVESALKVKSAAAKVKAESRELTRSIDRCYNPAFGSVFRSGLHQSFFSMQVGRYADLYAPSVLSFLHYSFLRSFTAPFLTLPHEGVEDVLQF